MDISGMTSIYSFIFETRCNVATVPSLSDLTDLKCDTTQLDIKKVQKSFDWPP